MESFLTVFEKTKYPISLSGSTISGINNSHQHLWKLPMCLLLFFTFPIIHSIIVLIQEHLSLDFH